MNRWDTLIKRLPKKEKIVGAEIGVLRGELSERLLSALPNLTLYMVDRWRPYAESEKLHHGPIAEASPGKWATWLRMTCERVESFGERAKIVVGESIPMAKQFPARFFDFVFIDATHTFKAVDADIQAWSAHLKPGGLLCGHDYNKKRYPGVIKAVHRRIKEGLEVDGTSWFSHLNPPSNYANQFRSFIGRDPDIKNPRTFSEYVMRKMLTEDTDLMMLTADKVRIRGYVKEKIGEKYCTPIIYHGGLPDAIPEGCAIKVNNASQKILVIKRGEKINREEIRATLSLWLEQNWLRGGLHYYRIKPQIVIEPILFYGEHDIFKIHCWMGKPEFIQATRFGEVDGKMKPLGRTWYNLEWEPIGMVYTDTPSPEFPRPHNLREMLEVATALSTPFDYVRVDLFLSGENIWVNELTHCPHEADPKIIPLDWQYKLGEIWKRHSN